VAADRGHSCGIPGRKGFGESVEHAMHVHHHAVFADFPDPRPFGKPAVPGIVIVRRLGQQEGGPLTPIEYFQTQRTTVPADRPKRTVVVGYRIDSGWSRNFGKLAPLDHLPGRAIPLGQYARILLALRQVFNQRGDRHSRHPPCARRCSKRQACPAMCTHPCHANRARAYETASLTASVCTLIS
jgi:hypothetical protein